MCALSPSGADTANKQLQQQNALQQKAFDNMLATQNAVKNATSMYTTGAGQGFDPAQLALTRSQFLNQNAQNYNQGAQNIKTALLRSGSMNGSIPMGGDAVRGLSGLEGSMASSQAAGLQNIDLQNLQQALTNKFNSLSLVNGQAAQMASPINSFGQGASNALDQYVTAQNSGFGAAFARGFGNSLGNTMGGGNMKMNWNMG